MNQLIIQYAPLVLMIIWFLVQNKFFITPSDLTEVLKNYALKNDFVSKEDLEKSLKDYVSLEHLRINYTSKTDMELERKELKAEIRNEYLEKVEFKQYEKRVQDNFDAIDRRLKDTSEHTNSRFDKIDASLEKTHSLLYELSKL